MSLSVTHISHCISECECYSCIMAFCALSFCLCLWVLLCKSATGFSGLRGQVRGFSRFLLLQMTRDDYMSFGSRMEINIKLPTREKEIAQLFLKNPKYILEQTWVYHLSHCFEQYIINSYILFNRNLENSFN